MDEERGGAAAHELVSLVGPSLRYQSLASKQISTSFVTAAVVDRSQDFSVASSSKATDTFRSYLKARRVYGGKGRR